MCIRDRVGDSFEDILDLLLAQNVGEGLLDGQEVRGQTDHLRVGVGWVGTTYEKELAQLSNELKMHKETKMVYTIFFRSYNLARKLKTFQLLDIFLGVEISLSHL